MFSLTAVKVLAGDLGPEPAQFSDLATYFARILNIAIGLAGIVVFLLLLAGGFKLLFSGGNPEQIKKASGTITWAIIGLVIFIAVWLIFLFIEEFTGVTVTEFDIPSI